MRVSDIGLDSSLGKHLAPTLPHRHHRINQSALDIGDESLRKMASDRLRTALVRRGPMRYPPLMC